MTNEELDEIEKRAAAATPGPWCCGYDEDSLYSGEAYVARFEHGDDQVFVAHARTDVPALVAEVRRLRGASERARENAKGAWFALEKDPARARFLLDQVENGLGDP